MDDFITTKQATEILNVSRQTLDSMQKRGLLEKYRKPYGRGLGSGRAVYWKRAQVESLKDERYIPVGEPPAKKTHKH